MTVLAEAGEPSRPVQDDILAAYLNKPVLKRGCMVRLISIGT
jgi:hypothetical protein